VTGEAVCAQRARISGLSAEERERRGRGDAHHQLAAPAMPTPARAPAPALVPRTSSLAVGWPSWTAERRPESTVSSSVRKAPVQRARRPPVRRPPLMPAHRTR